MTVKELMMNYRKCMEAAKANAERHEKERCAEDVIHSLGLDEAEELEWDEETRLQLIGMIRAADESLRRYRADELKRSVWLATEFESVLCDVADQRLRVIFRMYYADGMTDRQVAAHLHMSPETIKKIRGAWMKENGARHVKIPA